MGNKSNGRKVDLDFESRNWLLLVKLSKLGYSAKEAKRLAKKIETGRMSLRDLKCITE